MTTTLLIEKCLHCNMVLSYDSSKRRWIHKISRRDYYDKPIRHLAEPR